MTDQIDKLRTLNGELCAEINRQERRIRELESLLNVEIVRCRDCEHLEVFHPFDVYRLKPSEHAEYYCTSSQFSNWDFPIEVEPDGFCAWASKRKEGSDD